jgi:deferrochelatase/peroxidase EfeB
MSPEPNNSRFDVDEFADIQRLVRYGNGHLREACFLMLRISDAATARQWLGSAPVNSAAQQEQHPDTVLQVAFSADGLRALGLPQAAIDGFSDEFIVGMSGDANRSRRLGDTGANSPGDWDWGHQDIPHLLLMLYAGKDGIEDWVAAIEDKIFQSAFEVRHRLQTATLERDEPFGFADGISQPIIDWQNQLSTDLHARNDYSNQLKIGEILLGHVNEYGLYTDRPLLSPDTVAQADILPEAEDQPGSRDFGRNGCYLVMRQLEQDVPGFWQFVDQAAAGDAAERERLAAAMVGRQRDGTPLIASHENTAPGDALSDASADNEFSFDDDPLGRACPIGAHVRRANPRTGDFPPGTDSLLIRLLRTLGFCRRQANEDLVSSTRFHRLLRRGRAYGSVLTPEDATNASANTDPSPRGLHFICLGANIMRQFEFVQNAWLTNSHFGGLSGESDPLLGNREVLADGGATDAFTEPQVNAPAKCQAGLPQFVTVRGGAYFFMPGIKALRFIATHADGASHE